MQMMIYLILNKIELCYLCSRLAIDKALAILVVMCGILTGQQFRWRIVSSSLDNFPTPIQVKSCQPDEELCNDVDYGNCIPVGECNISDIVLYIDAG